MDKVSVIVTCYNHEKYIKECLESIFNQTYNNIELIVINDGSKDNSEQVIVETLAQSPFKETTHFYQDNMGACLTRNRGLDLVSGEYILIVDSDNYLEKNHIQTSLEALKNSQTDIAYCSLRNAATGEVLNEVPEFSLDRLITVNFIDTCSLFRKSAMKDHRFDPELNRLFMQDYDFFLGLVHDGAKAIKVKGLYLNYRVIESSVGNRAEKKDERVKWVEVHAYINRKYPEYANNASSFLGTWFLELNRDFEVVKDSEEEKEAKIKKLEKNLEELDEIKGNLNQAKADYRRLDQLYLSIVHSKSWKIGRILTHPYRKFLSFKNRYIKKDRPIELQVDDYQNWINTIEPKSFQEEKLGSVQPLISILVPVYNVEKKWLDKCVQSVMNQTYSNWELCLSDDCSTSKETAQALVAVAQLDERIHVVYRKENGNISAATNSALEIAKGEYVALMDNDDELSPLALIEVVRALNNNSELDLIYSDEDKINQDGKRFAPHFKPEWSPDLILNQNYISHLGVYRTKIAKEIGGFRLGYEGAQDHDFLLRFTEKILSENIHHIAKVLYHWRAIEGSTALGADEKSYAYDRGVRAVQDALNRRGLKGIVRNGHYPGLYDVTYDLIKSPLVSIVIPTKNGYSDLKECVDSIISKSTYKNFEIIVADNGSDDPKLQTLFAQYEIELPNRFKRVFLDIPFNYSRINNLAVKESNGDFLLFLNNDTSVITPNWIEEMLGFAQFKRVGCVGAKLWYPDNTVQHGGVILGVGGVAGHAFLNSTKTDPGYFSRLYTDYNYTAVTAACLMVSRQDFEAVSGFDESLAVAFNDVDFCIRVFQLGRNNVWAHQAELYHYESKSRGYEDTPEKVKRFNKEIEIMNVRYGDLLNHDPAYNVNFELYAAPYSTFERQKCR